MKTKAKNHFLKRYTLPIYYIITFFITIILGAIYSFTYNPFITPQYAPTIGLVLLCLIQHNWCTWRYMNWKPAKTNKFLLWLIISLLLPVVVITISAVILSSLGHHLVIWKDTTAGYIITIITAILGCITEEIGWRGYLLPLFEKNHSMLFSSIITGLLWGIWHCKFIYGVIGYLFFIVLIIFFSIIMTWIFMITNRNLLCMILFHFGVNIGSVTLLQNREGILFYFIATILCLLVCIPIVYMNKQQFIQKKVE
jgi:membrane protease YdiL (CAAX protease family)